MSTTPKNLKTAHPLTFGLSMVAGIGLILLIGALAYGVAVGESANMNVISGLFIIGLLLFLSGLIGWLAVVRPFERFDDINVPQYTGHHGHESHGHAIVVSSPDESAPAEPHGETHHS